MNIIILSDKVFASFFQIVVVSIRIDIHFLNDLFPCFPLNVMLKNKSSFSPFPYGGKMFYKLLVVEWHFIEQKIKEIGFFQAPHRLELLMK